MYPCKTKEQSKEFRDDLVKKIINYFFQLEAKGIEGGFVKEFVDTVWKPLAKDIIDRKIKVITNAGGSITSNISFSQY